MSERLAELAWKAVEAHSAQLPGEGSAERIGRVMESLFHLCDAHDLDVNGMINEARRQWRNTRSACGVADGGANQSWRRGSYSGWDRIHDDNKAEGRPIGGQWNSEGVDYSNGYKVRRSR